jgi:hypothetical protein
LKLQDGARDTYVGGLKGSLEDCDGVILSSDIVEILWSAVSISVRHDTFRKLVEAYYFSTHGCRPGFSFAGTTLAAAPFVAAASLRALISKNPAMILIGDRFRQGDELAKLVLDVRRCNLSGDALKRRDFLPPLYARFFGEATFHLTRLSVLPILMLFG